MQDLTVQTKPGTTRRRAPANGRKRSPVAVEERYFDRELSWLEFNARVLDEALNPAHPLLERLKFLAIFSNNLDEFFMIYVPGMREREDVNGRPLTETAIKAQLRAIQLKLEPMLALQARCFQELRPQLAAHGIRILNHNQLTKEQKEWLRNYFEEEIFPILTPLAVDPGHPFPYISNLSLSRAVVVRDPVTG
jgi:polyphosphate kinase